MGRTSKYSADVHEYIREHHSEMTLDEMITRVNDLYGTEFDNGKLRSYYKNHKLHIGVKPKRYSKAWPKEVVECIEEVHKGRSYSEIISIIKERTGREYQKNQVKTFIHNHKLNTGRTGQFEKGGTAWAKGKKRSEFMTPEGIERCKKTQFKKGKIPDNTVPVGSIRKNADGYMIIKVKEKGTQWERWHLLHRDVWEAENGPIPAGHIVSFKDGNKENCDISNLYLMTMGENACMNHKGYRSESPELTQLGLSTVRLEMAVRNKRKERKK